MHACKNATQNPQGVVGQYRDKLSMRSQAFQKHARLCCRQNSFVSSCTGLSVHIVNFKVKKRPFFRIRSDEP